MKIYLQNDCMYFQLWLYLMNFARSDIDSWQSWRNIVALVLQQVVFVWSLTISSSLITFPMQFKFVLIFNSKKDRPSVTPSVFWRVFQNEKFWQTNFSEETLTKSRNLSKRRTLKMLRCMLSAPDLDKRLLNSKGSTE